jgi:hypothetical protein
MVLNLSTVELPPLPAEDACAISKSASARTTTRIQFFVISPLSRFHVGGAARADALLQVLA